MKQLLISILCIYSAFQAGAQSFGAYSFNSGNQQLIEDAVKDGLFIVHRSYRLKDTTAQTPVYYGWDNAEHFGYSCSLGVKAENGYYLSRKAVYPWQYDSRFDEYSGSRQYIPVVSESKYKSLSDSVLFDFPYKSDGQETLAGEQFYFERDSLFENKGFRIDGAGGVKKGWLVWLTEDFSLLIYRTELEFTAGKAAYPVKDPSTSKEVIGGLYVVPQLEGIGQIRFRLSGLVSGEAGQWQVVRLNRPGEKSLDERPDVISKPVRSKDKKGLTPVNPE